MSPQASSNLPPDIGRATLHTSVYLILQPMTRTAVCVTTNSGGLLPHLLTLTNRSWRLFSSAFVHLHKRLPVRKHGALCCPDFPLTQSASDRPTYYLCKDNYILRIKTYFRFIYLDLTTEKTIFAKRILVLTHQHSGHSRIPSEFV